MGASGAGFIVAFSQILVRFTLASYRRKPSPYQLSTKKGETMQTKLKIGNVGARLDDTPGLWRIDTIWQASGELEIFNINDKELFSPALISMDEFWPLLDSFPA